MFLLTQIPEAIREHGEAVSITSIVSGVIAAFKIWDNRKGKRRDSNTRTILMDIHEELRKLSWFVSGPNGDRGLVKDVEDLKISVDQLRIQVARHMPPDDLRGGF